MTMNIGRGAAEFGFLWIFRLLPITVSESWRLEFLSKKYSRFKNSIFVNFYLELYFQGHLLQELDGQTHCDNFVKTCWRSVEYYRGYPT